MLFLGTLCQDVYKEFIIRSPEEVGSFGFRAWGLGFRVQGLGLGFRVQGLGFRVEGLGPAQGLGLGK